MKIDISLGDTLIHEHIKSIVTNERLVYASPCHVKHQEEWFKNIIFDDGSRIKFSSSESIFKRDDSVAIYTKSLLHVQFVRDGFEFFNWWSELLKLNSAEKESALKHLKKIGIGQDKLEGHWSEMKFQNKIFIILAPAFVKHKIVHLFMGDYFVENEELTIFSNQIHSFLGTSDIMLLLFWSLNLRNVKGHRLYFSGFSGESNSEN